MKDISQLVKKDNGTYYLKKENVEYTGKYYSKSSKNTIVEEGFMKNGKLEGIIKLYNEEGVLLVEAGYKEGEKDGEAITYYESGHIKAAIELKKNLRHGKLKMWNENGGKKYEAFFVEDKLNGKQTKYYKNGKKKIETHYLEGIEHSKRIVWKENGEKIFEANFIKGELT